MHTLFRLFSLCIILALSACGTDLGSFDINEKSDEVIVQGGPSIIELPINIFPAMTLDINLQQELDAQDASGAKAVYLSALSLNVTDKAKANASDVDNFDFVESVTIYVESTKENSALKKTKVAEVKMVPDGLQVLPLTVFDNVNLKPFIEEGMRLSSEGTASVPEDDVSMLADVTIKVQVL